MDKQAAAKHHTNAAAHLKKASQAHEEAATHYTADKPEQAAVAAVKAHGHTCSGLEHAKEASKTHTQQ